MNVEISRVDYTNAAECKELLTLLDNYARDPMGGGAPLSEYSKSNLASSLALTPGAASWLARIDSKAVGFSNCFQGFSTFACKPVLNIHDIAVDADYRGRGIAHALLGAITEHARDIECCKITLEVLVGNPKAKSVYRDVGFNPAAMKDEHGPYEFWDKPLR